jgi:hypothetical protein
MFGDEVPYEGEHTLNLDDYERLKEVGFFVSGCLLLTATVVSAIFLLIS